MGSIDTRDPIARLLPVTRIDRQRGLDFHGVSIKFIEWEGGEFGRDHLGSHYILKVREILRGMRMREWKKLRRASYIDLLRRILTIGRVSGLLLLRFCLLQRHKRSLGLR